MKVHDHMSPATGNFYPSGSHRAWSHVISAFIVTVMAGALVACSMGYGELGDPEDHQAQNKRTGRTILVDNQAETVGYGLYSYLLFESPPTPQTKPLYLAIISACLKEFPDLDGLRKEHRPESLNVIHLPVTRNISAPRAEEILQYYSYERAQAILGQLSMIQRNGGPYLASSLVPVSNSSRANQSLYQDLSAIHFVSHQEDQINIARNWVLGFVNQVSKPRAWDRATLATFTDEIRERIQPVFTSQGLSADKLDLKKYIVFPIPDNKTEQIFPFIAWKTSVDNGSRHRINVREQ